MIFRWRLDEGGDPGEDWGRPCLGLGIIPGEVLGFLLAITLWGLRLRFGVQPRAARTAINGTLGEALKISLSAPPVDGRANAAVVDFFSEILSVPLLF